MQDFRVSSFRTQCEAGQRRNDRQWPKSDGVRNSVSGHLAIDCQRTLTANDEPIDHRATVLYPGTRCVKTMTQQGLRSRHSRGSIGGSRFNWGKGVHSVNMRTLSRCFLCENGAPGRIRTSDHLVRSQVLYPTELRARGIFEPGRIHEFSGLASPWPDRRWRTEGRVRPAASYGLRLRLSRKKAVSMTTVIASSAVEMALTSGEIMRRSWPSM